MQDGALYPPSDDRPVLGLVCDYRGEWSFWCVRYVADLGRWVSDRGVVVFWDRGMRRPAPWWSELPAVPAELPAVPVQGVLLKERAK